jgi:hypothetical protein
MKFRSVSIGKERYALDLRALSFVDRSWDALGPDVASTGDRNTNDSKKYVKGGHQDSGACLHEQCRPV